MMLVKDRVSVIVVYASQQGNAQAIAEDLHEELREHLKEPHVSLRLECISKLGEDPCLLSKSDCAVFIAATTGDGDPPDTARKLWRTLNKSKPSQSGNSKIGDSRANSSLTDSGSGTQDKEKVSSDSSGRVANDPSKLEHLPSIIPEIPRKDEIRLKEGDSLAIVTDSIEAVDKTQLKVDDSPEKVDDSPEKVDDSPEKVDDSPEKVDDSPEKVVDSPEKVVDSPEKVDDSPERVDDSPEKVDNSPEKVDNSPENNDNIDGLSELKVLLAKQLSQTDEYKLCVKIPDANMTQTNDVSRYQLKLDGTNERTNSTKPITVSAKKATELKERSGKVIDHKIELPHLTYTVLGLGDTNYTNFCNFGKNLDEILHQLGARRFYPCGWADDGTGLEIVIEPWKENFWRAISEHVVELARNKHERTSATISENETKVISGRASDGGVKMALDESKAFSDTKVVSGNGCDIDGRENSDVIVKLENLHLNDLELWRLKHPLLRLEFTPETKLTLPKIPILDSIVLDLSDETNPDDYTTCYQNNAFLPSAKSGISNCTVVEFRHLSRSVTNKSTKKVVEVILQQEPEDEFEYEPGDSVAVLAHNHSRDVELVLEKLRASPDRICRLSRNPGAKKQLPPHLPTCSSLRDIFTTCVDIRCTPKKALLLQFLKCCSDPHEIQCLQELVSREGSELYLKKILGDHITFIDLLFVFQSCRLEISALLEVLPRLLPRAYSLTSSPLSKPKQLSFVYSLTVIPKCAGRLEERKGVCTGLFDSLDERKCADPARTVELALYLRSNQSFRLPTDYTKPIIMVGPGTGVAPFVGFLRHRKHQLDQETIDASKVGESWLFFGCRFRDADELFKTEIQEFMASNVLTNFYSCFSREHQLRSIIEENNEKYVQDLLRLHSSSLVSAITESDAVVYVCGDAANMAKDVYATFSSILTEHFGDELQGSRYLSQMQKEKRYLQDVWT